MPVDFSKLPLDPNSPAPYGYLVPPDTSNMPQQIGGLIRNQNWPGGTPIPQDQYDALINQYMITSDPERYDVFRQLGDAAAAWEYSQGRSSTPPTPQPTLTELQRQWAAPAMAAPPPSGSVAVTPAQVQQMKDTQAAGGLYSVLNPAANIAPATTQAKVAAQQAVYGGNYTSAADMLNAIRAYASGTVPAPPTQPVNPTPAPMAPATPQTPAAVATPKAVTPPTVTATNLPATPYTPGTSPAPKISTRIPGFSAPAASSFKVPNLARATQKRWSNFPTTTY